MYLKQIAFYLLAVAPFMVYLKNPYGIKLTKLECEYSPTLCVNSTCLLKPVNRTTSKVTVGCYFTETQSVIKIDVSSFTKSSSNAYYPGSFRFKDDFCAITRGSGNSIMIKVFAKSLEGSESMLKPCPISGKHMIENYVVNSKIIPSTLLPSGQHRIDVREYNKDNATMMAVKYYFTITNPFF